MPGQKLNRSFYTRSDVVEIARDLLGKVLCTRLGNKPLTSGMIVETEAYRGRNDKACHANDGRRTQRTEIMYHEGGVAYVYLCYGIHHLFNVVTNVEDTADAVLIRAIKPIDGTETILERRNASELKPIVSAGPGRLTQALGITTDHDGIDLTGESIWIEDRGTRLADRSIIKRERIGVDYAGNHALREWRFFLGEEEWVSR